MFNDFGAEHSLPLQTGSVLEVEAVETNIKENVKTLSMNGSRMPLLTPKELSKEFPEKILLLMTYSEELLNVVAGSEMLPR